MLAPAAIAKIECDLAGVPREPAPIVGGEDYPHQSHLTRDYTKRMALSEAQNHRCAYCGIKFRNDVAKNHPDAATIDHVMPRCAGGKAIWSNEVMACHQCNQGRGAMVWQRYFDKVLKSGRDRARSWGNWQRSQHDRKAAGASVIRPQAPDATALGSALNALQK